MFTSPHRQKVWRWTRLILVNLILTVVLLEVVSYVVILASGESVAELHEQLQHRGNSAIVEAGRQITPHVLHPYFGYTYDPSKGAGPNSVNNHGFIGTEDILTKNSANDFNVAIVGGSVANNFFVYSADDLQRRLKALPALKEKNVNVFSFSAGGYHQPQQLLLVNYYLACCNAKIDLLLNIDGYNEIMIPHSYATSRTRAMFYPYQWEFFADKMMNPEVRKLYGRITYRDRARDKRVAWYNGSFLGYSGTVTLAMSRWERHHRNHTQRLVERLSDLETWQATFSVHGRIGPDVGEDQVFDRIAEAWSRSSLMLSRIARDHGFPYIHVLQPNQYVPGSKALTEKERRVAWRSDAQDKRYNDLIRTGYEVLGARIPGLKAKRVHIIDGRLLYADTEEDIFTDVMGHVNRKGSEIMMGAVLRYLEEHFLLTPR